MVIRLQSRKIGLLVRQLRRCYRVSPVVLAAHLNISPDQLGKCERGQRSWRAEDLRALDRFFNTTAIMDAARAAFGDGPEAA